MCLCLGEVMWVVLGGIGGWHVTGSGRVVCWYVCLFWVWNICVDGRPRNLYIVIGGYLRILCAPGVLSCCTLSIFASYRVFVCGRYRKSTACMLCRLDPSYHHHPHIIIIVPSSYYNPVHVLNTSRGIIAVTMRDKFGLCYSTMRDKFGLCFGCWPCDVRPCSSHVQIRISSLALY